MPAGSRPGRETSSAGSRRSSPPSSRRSARTSPERNMRPALDLDLAPAFEALAGTDAMRTGGRVTDVVGLVIEATGPAAPVGALCAVATADGAAIAAEVVGFREGRALLMPLGPLAG